MDAIPVFSQVKSAVQWIFKDAEGARQTQINFSRQCPVVSQVRSMVEASRGDQKAAQETQKQCGNFMLNLINGIPVVGHIKGTVHYIVGDKEGGGAAMKAASHTSAVIGGGVGGFFLGGPVGAVAGGIGAGVAIDSTITATDSAINKTLKPYGVFEPLADPTNPGKWCDAAGGIVFDGLVGRCAGKVVQQVKLNNISKTGAVLDNVVETVIEDRVIPKPLAPILNYAKIWIRNQAGNLDVKFMRYAQERVEKELHSKAQNFDGKQCKLEISREVMPEEKALAEALGASVKLNGNVLEVYLGGKLILIHNGNSAYYVNSNGGMERVEHGIMVNLCSNGEYSKSDVGCEAVEMAQPQISAIEHEDGSVGCFGKELEYKTISEFTYDSRQKKISWGPCEQNIDTEEERQSFPIPVSKCSLRTV